VLDVRPKKGKNICKISEESQPALANARTLGVVWIKPKKKKAGGGKKK
jgi:hypothetical protein